MDLSKWSAGRAPVAVIMLSLNEAHNMEGVLANLRGWAQEVFLVDSVSSDETVDIALAHGVHVVQRRFRGFGDQWNFALQNLPITASWTLKLDPDERLSEELKQEIVDRLQIARCDGFRIPIRLYFMGRRLGHELNPTRLWRTGCARFSAVLANEYALVNGTEENMRGEIRHQDSPHLDHWISKQNRYSTAEAIIQYERLQLSALPKLCGSWLERRMWLKKNFNRIPGRYMLLFLYLLLLQGGWRAGRVGVIWARLRTEHYRVQEYKLYEMKLRGQVPKLVPTSPGSPDPRVPFCE